MAQKWGVISLIANLLLFGGTWIPKTFDKNQSQVNMGVTMATRPASIYTNDFIVTMLPESEGSGSNHKHAEWLAKRHGFENRGNVSARVTPCVCWCACVSTCLSVVYIILKCRVANRPLFQRTVLYLNPPSLSFIKLRIVLYF